MSARTRGDWRENGAALGVISACAALLWALDQTMPDTDTLLAVGRTAVAGQPLLAMPLFGLGASLLTAVGLSRQAVALVGGYLFGPLLGTALALTGTLAGCSLAYAVAARLGRPGLDRWRPAYGSRLDAWTREHAFAKVLMLRLFPLGSNLATNLAAGVARVPLAAFLAASLIGFLPQTLIFALTGTGLGEGRVQPVLLAAALLTVSVVLAYRLLRSTKTTAAR